MLTEVLTQSGEERLESDVCHQLLEDAGALRVGDAVEVHLDGGQVRNVRGNRVRRRQLVLAVRPRLLDVGERRPGVRVLRGLGLAQDRSEGRERLVEPQVVPPRHRDEVAEPHVRHFVQDRFGTTLVRVAGHLGAEDVVLEECHGAGILHRARIEFGDEELVVLAESIGNTEVAVVEVESLLGLGEEPLLVHELGQ